MAGKKYIKTVKRGVYKTWEITIPASKYVAGGKLLFGAKPSYDNDTGDSKAILKKTLTDDDISRTETNGDKVFLLKFERSDTLNLPIDQETDYIAEFEYFDTSGRSTVYPDAESKVSLILRLEPAINLRSPS